MGRVTPYRARDGVERLARVSLLLGPRIERVAARRSADYSADVLSDEIVEADQHLRELRARTGAAIRGTVGIGATVTLMAPRTVPRSEGGKLQRVVDQRHLA